MELIDNRGMYVCKSQDDDLRQIKEHIMELPVVDSHYCRQRTKRQYLERSLSITKMYQLYLTWCVQKKVVAQKEWAYRKVFLEKFNLGFHTPRKDYCDYCNEYNIAIVERRDEMKGHFDAHMRRKLQARENKEADKQRAINDKTFHAANFDLEKVLVTLYTNVSKLYYKRKLSTFNFTIYNLATTDAVCCMWHQGNGSKVSSEAATCLFDYMSSLPRSVTSVTLYSDTAGGQNRNQAVAIMCLTLLKKSDHIITVNQKYKESGHSEMEGDSVHSLIERTSTKIPIYSPDG